MTVHANPFKRALNARRRQFGVTARLCSPDAVEVMSRSGFDYIMIDTEHTPNELPGVLSQIRAMEGGTAVPPVRPAWNDAVLIKRLLDVGVQSLLMPMVETADDARRDVAAVRYPPHGVRGVNAVTRATQWGRTKDYFKHADQEIAVVVMIETRKGMDNLEEIVGVDGVDGVEFGALDYSFDIGLAGNSGDPQVRMAVERGIQRVAGCGKAPGVTAYAQTDARMWLEKGAQFVTVGSDLNLVARYSDALADRVQRTAIRRLGSPYRCSNQAPAG